MIVPICVGAIIGMFIGRFLRPVRQCPLVIRGYQCKGHLCDHSDSKYYEAKYYEAMDRERFNTNGRF